MVIWILNPFDDIPGEGPVLRYWTLAEELSKRGHQVVWWSSDWSHRRKQRRTVEVSRQLSFTIQLVATPAYRKNISLARICSHRKWGKQLFHDALDLVGSGSIKRPDLIVASLPPLEGPNVALRLRSRFKCKVVCDVMDAWPDTLLQAAPTTLRGVVGICLWPYLRMLRKACRHSDAASAQSFRFAEYSKEHGAKSDPYVCYLGAASDRVAVDRAPKDAHCVHFVYIGSMGKSYDLETVVNAVKQLSETGQNCELHIAGEGEKLLSLKALAADKLDNAIHFHGYLQQADLNELLSRCHVGIVPMKPDSMVAMPYKVGEYLAAGLPVINSLPGELADLLQSGPCGQPYVVGNVESLTKAMRHYTQMTNGDYDQERKAARAVFESHFDKSKTYPRFAQWILEQSDAKAS